MGLFDSIDIGVSALNAQKLRMDVISRNLANANTTKTANGTPYRRQMVVMREIKSNSFADYMNAALRKNNAGKGVEVSAVVDDTSPFVSVYNPSHPDADARGYVLMPNVSTISEMVDMISASRAYEANITTINTSKSMALKALDLAAR